MIYLWIIILLIIFIYFIRINLIKKSLKKQELIIIEYFFLRTNLIPPIFEVTKNTFSKHDEIFSEIIKLRKMELYKKNDDNFENNFIKLIHNQKLIHNELNFIFRVANKHPKLTKKWNFIYIRNLLIDKSYILSKLLEDYKSKVLLYNKLIINPIYKKTEI